MSYSTTTIQDRQQYMLTGLLQTIKHVPEDDLQQLVTLIRGSSRIDSVATCLREHFATLQDKGIIPAYDIDDTDVISFGLRGLCAYRKGPARPNSPFPQSDQASNGIQSPAALSLASEDSSQAVDDMAVETSRDEASLNAPSLDNDEPFDPVGDFDSSDMFNHPFDSHFLPHQDDHLLPFETSSGYPRHLHTVSDSYPSHTVTADHANLPDAFTGFHPSASWAPQHSQAAHYQQQQQHLPTPPPTFGNTYTMIQYYASLANGTPPTTTLNPSLALKPSVAGSLPQHHQPQRQHGAMDAPVFSEFSHSYPSYASQPQTLRSNA